MTQPSTCNIDFIKQHIFDYGFCQIKGVFDKTTVDSVLAKITTVRNANLQQEDSNLRNFTDDRFFPEEFDKCQLIQGLINNVRLRECLVRILDFDQIDLTPNQLRAQVAVRRAQNLAQCGSTLARPKQHDSGPHLDGRGGRNPYIPILNFCCLVGIYLDGVAESDSGNFTVWPRSHRATDNYIKRTGPGTMFQNFNIGCSEEPYQFRTDPGDVVIAHYNTVHRAAINTSTQDRTAIYFRLYYKEIPAHAINGDGNYLVNIEKRWYYFSNIWAGWNSTFATATTALLPAPQPANFPG